MKVHSNIIPAPVIISLTSWLPEADRKEMVQTVRQTGKLAHSSALRTERHSSN